MSWDVTLLGQPPSLNHLYGIVWRYSSDRRRYKGIGKTEAATDYMNDCIRQISSARPSRWAPEGQVRIHWWFYLHRDADCDNLKKIISDAIQAATGVNDRWFLSTDEEKIVGVPKNEARVVLLVDDQPASPLRAPGS